MYNLDINFSKDREPISQESGTAVSVADSQFFDWGRGCSGGIAGDRGRSLLFLQSQVDSLNAELGRLTAQESGLDAQLKVLSGSEAEITAINARNTALAALITKDIPTSVILQDMRLRTPESIQVFTIAQTGLNITITGQGAGFNEVNDFLLLLQKSPYLDPDKTKLSNARQKPPVKGVDLTLVDYQITTSLVTKPTDKLVADLEKSEAQGAVTRVKLLQEKGVIAQ